jgi:opacity protein-like surface antigen
MKKIILSAIAVCAFGFMSAQDMKFGVKAGVNMATAKIDVAGMSVSNSGTGFFVGGLAEFALADNIKIQPEVLYHSLKIEKIDYSFLNVPVIFKYYFTEEFAVNAGPSIYYFFDGDKAFKNADQSTFKVNLDVGASYDITENFEVSARYSLGLMGDLKVSGIHLGVGYKF